MIGTTLVADGFGVHFNHAFIYVSMVFSVAVEWLNMVARRRAAKVVHLPDPYGNPEAAVESGDEPRAGTQPRHLNQIKGTTALIRITAKPNG